MTNSQAPPQPEALTDTHMLTSREQVEAWNRVREKFKDAGWTVADATNFRLMFGWGYRAGMAELEEQNRQLVRALREATEAPAFDPDAMQTDANRATTGIEVQMKQESANGLLRAAVAKAKGAAA